MIGPKNRRSIEELSFSLGKAVIISDELPVDMERASWRCQQRIGCS